MKRLLIFISLLGAFPLWGQSVTLAFSGRDQNNEYVQLDRVVIANLSRGWQETIAFPDTVYTLSIGVGVEDYAMKEEVKVMPNPFDGATRVNLGSQESERARITIVDMQGRTYAHFSGTLESGDNYFNICLSTPQVYILTVQTPTRRQSLKMVNTGHGGSDRIQYTGSTYTPRTLQLKATSTHDFLPGDYMRYIGYATIDGVQRQSAVVAQPQSSDETLTLEFFAADAIPCPGMSTVTDHEGNVYHTVQIGSQCWTRENMRCVTSPTTGTYLITPEGTPYTCTGKQAHWMLGDSATYAPLGYGVLYNWNAAVDTFNTAYGELSVDTTRLHPVWAFFHGHRRGICPEGWHVPDYTEWCVMFNYVSAQNEYVCDRIPHGDPDSPDYYDVYYAKSLAAQIGWSETTAICDPGNDQSANNATGFSALPAGWYYTGYNNVFTDAAFWSSSRGTLSCPVAVYMNSKVRSWPDPDNCFSVRCLRDSDVEEEIVEEEKGTPCPDMPTVTDHEGNVYHTVQIGSQCWTKENMRCKTSPHTGAYLVSNALSYSSHSYVHPEPGAYWINQDSSSNLANELGMLYSLGVAMDTAAGGWVADSSGYHRGICPEGWHVPSHIEWQTLEDYFLEHSELCCNSNPSYTAKALASQTGWLPVTVGGPCMVGNYPANNNVTGLTIRPIFYRTYYELAPANYMAYINYATFFCSDIYYMVFLYSNSGWFEINTPAPDYLTSTAASVRCLRNE